MTRDDIIRMAREAGLIKEWMTLRQEDVEALGRFAAAERERICTAIKTEDDYCVDKGDYMLDSDDCIAIVNGKWKRPDFSAAAIRARGQA